MDDATSELYAGFWSRRRAPVLQLRRRGSVHHPRLFSVCTVIAVVITVHPRRRRPGGSSAPPPSSAAPCGQLAIQMIAAYSPEARGRSERMFRTQQQRLVRELASAELPTWPRLIATWKYYPAAFNAEFAQPALEPGSAFVPWAGADLDHIVCWQVERQVGADNCVSFGRLTLQIPTHRHRFQFVKPPCACISISMARWRCSMDPAVWLVTAPTVSSSRTSSVPRNVRSRPPETAGSRLSGSARDPRSRHMTKRTTYVLLNRTVLFATNIARLEMSSDKPHRFV